MKIEKVDLDKAELAVGTRYEGRMRPLCLFKTGKGYGWWWNIVFESEGGRKFYTVTMSDTTADDATKAIEYGGFVNVVFVVAELTGHEETRCAMSVMKYEESRNCLKIKNVSISR